MSPKVSTVLALARELTDEERKDVRLQLELDEGAAARGRKAPKLPQHIVDELVRRFDNPTPGPGVSPEVAIRRARKTVEAMKRKKHQRSNPK